LDLVRRAMHRIDRRERVRSPCLSTYLSIPIILSCIQGTY